MNSAIEINRSTFPHMIRPEKPRADNANKLEAWNKVMRIFADDKRTQDKASGKKIEMALYIHELRDPQSRTVEFIRSSTANRFVNMVTIRPAEGTEGPEEEFKWSAADPAVSSTEFSEARLVRLGKAMDLLDNSLKRTDTDGKA